MPPTTRITRRNRFRYHKPILAQVRDAYIVTTPTKYIKQTRITGLRLRFAQNPPVGRFHIVT